MNSAFPAHWGQTPDPMLTPAQIQSYHDTGYLGVEGVFSPAEVAELRRVTDEFVEKSRAVTANDAVFDLEPSHTPAEGPDQAARSLPAGDLASQIARHRQPADRPGHHEQRQ